MNEFKEAEFPAIPLSLIEKLEVLIPEKCPDLSMGERDIFFYSGQRAVVKMLRQVYNEQNEVS